MSAWSSVTSTLPGRLRACANDECNLFLVDHSRPGTAKWCSMATCGNRMKARAHARRAKD
ncbi:CGNR zinc finger domain-containing protein [Frigoribacterium sp. Leaf415]|uniref:CGNR zinc finger domain-containing protein n=1 Tax=unclassified Frigoribacterium TaxID=2627005 RepID=UPI002E11816F